MANPDAAKCVMIGLKEGNLGFGAYQTKLEKVYTPDESKDKGKWEFVHWPIKCRANFARLVLEECNIDYIDNYGDDYCKKQIASPFLGKMKPDFNRKFESMGPPFLRKVGDPNSFISQSVMMTQYLADEYCLRPKSKVNHYMAGMIVGNCCDIFEELKSKSIKIKSLYNNPKTQKKAEQMYFDYLNGRIKIWLTMLIKPLTIKKNQKYYFDDKITQADLALFNILDMMLEWMTFKPFQYFILNKYPILNKHYLNMLQNSKGVQKLLKRQKKEKVLWWPYYGSDVMGIELAGKVFQKKLKEIKNKEETEDEAKDDSAN